MKQITIEESLGVGWKTHCIDRAVSLRQHGSHDVNDRLTQEVIASLSLDAHMSFFLSDDFRYGDATMLRFVSCSFAFSSLPVPALQSHRIVGHFGAFWNTIWIWIWIWLSNRRFQATHSCFFGLMQYIPNNPLCCALLWILASKLDNPKVNAFRPVDWPHQWETLATWSLGVPIGQRQKCCFKAMLF